MLPGAEWTRSTKMDFLWSIDADTFTTLLQIVLKAY